MASFELVGYVKSSMRISGRTRLTVGEYVQGKRNSAGEVENEKMDLWFVFFPPSSYRHLLNFKPGDLVIVKGTIHQSVGSSEYAYAINGECIKHFYTRNLLGDVNAEKASKAAMEKHGETPQVSDAFNDDF